MAFRRHEAGRALARTFASALVFPLALAPAQAAAQAFPSKAITIMVPFQAGGAADVATRLVAQKASDLFRQAVVVDNRPGAGGVVAGEAVRKSPADGHTLMLGTTGTHAVSTALNPKLPYDPVRDFLPVTTLVSTGNVLVVGAGSPARSVADLVALARTRPGGLTFASQGIGSGGQLLGEMLKSREKVELVHVLYKGSAPALTDVVTGRVDLFFDALITAVPLVRDGKLRALAVASPRRSPHLPDVPTMAEAGFPGIESENWFGLFASAGVPAANIEVLNREFVRAARDPEVSARLAERAMDVIADSPADLAARMRDDSARLGRIIREAGIRIN